MNIGISGNDLLQQWNIECDDRMSFGRKPVFLKAAKNNNPTRNTGAYSLLLIGDSFLCTETSSKLFRQKLSISFERTVVIQISKITFYCNRCSTPSSCTPKCMGRLRIHILLN